MKDILSPKITMLTTRSSNHIAGRVTLNGQEWVVKPFEIAKGASARDKENALLKQALSERENDGMETIKVSMGDL